MDTAEDKTRDEPPVGQYQKQCDWCRKFFSGEGVVGGELKEKCFCGYACHRNDWEHYHDNFFSDADAGL